jgi:hypothetical protein
MSRLNQELKKTHSLGPSYEGEENTNAKQSMTEREGPQIISSSPVPIPQLFSVYSPLPSGKNRNINKKSQGQLHFSGMMVMMM